MYSLLLMTALTTGGDTASFGGRFSGCTGSSCYGAAVVTSCSGCSGYVTSCTGCSGYVTSCSGCTGCCGGSGFLGLRAHFAKHSSCQGSSCCGGSCYSSSCCGGWGACYGSCTGCSGTIIYGATPVMSGSMAPAASASSYTIGSMQVPAFRNWEMSPRVHGINYSGPYYSGENYAAWPNGVGVRTFSPGYTYGGGYGTGVVGPYFYGADFRPYVPQGPITGTLANPLYVPGAPIPMSIEFEAAKAKPSVSAPANLIVKLPADAKFYVDGALTKGEGTTRNFHTPELPHGKTFFYDLKAEVTVEGKLIVENKRVLVRGGEDINESFPKLLAAAKSSSKEPTAIASSK